jgi:hypothetical protein
MDTEHHGMLYVEGGAGLFWRPSILDDRGTVPTTFCLCCSELGIVATGSIIESVAIS